MLLSLSIILLSGILLAYVFEKMKLPRLLGMLLAGILIGPYSLNLLDDGVLRISTELRQIALIIILTRAGLNLNLHDLKQVGRPAILLCFVPASFEILGTILLAPKLLRFSLLDATILGTVLAAVSPAVIVPRMLRLMSEGYGKKNHIPEMIMAGASVDDVFVIVLFSVFTKLAQTGSASPVLLLSIPSSIFLGILIGYLTGLVFVKTFKSVQVPDSIKVCIMLAVAFFFVSLEQKFSGPIGFSGLLAVMAIGVAIQSKAKEAALNLSGKFSELWLGFEVMLFVLVGSSVDFRYALHAGFASFLLIFGILIFRSIGVLVSVGGTKLNNRERLFALISYLPKATVQAAIGGIPLSMGLAKGEMILAIAVLSIIITAPLGAVLIDTLYPRLLNESDTTQN